MVHVLFPQFFLMWFVLSFFKDCDWTALGWRRMIKPELRVAQELAKHVGGPRGGKRLGRVLLLNFDTIFPMLCIQH